MAGETLHIYHRVGRPVIMKKEKTSEIILGKAKSFNSDKLNLNLNSKTIQVQVEILWSTQFSWHCWLWDHASLLGTCWLSISQNTSTLDPRTSWLEYGIQEGNCEGNCWMKHDLSLTCPWQCFGTPSANCYYPLYRK